MHFNAKRYISIARTGNCIMYALVLFHENDSVWLFDMIIKKYIITDEIHTAKVTRAGSS